MTTALTHELTVLAFGLPGGAELWIILFVGVLLFGATRIPTMMRSLGSGIVEFKKGLRGELDDEDKKLPPGEDEAKE